MDLLGVVKLDLLTHAFVDKRLRMVLQRFVRLRGASMAKSRVAGNGVQPRRQAAWLAQGADAVEYAQPGLLQHIPGVGLIADETADEIEQSPLPGADEFFQGGPVSASAAQREKFTGHGVLV